MADPPPGAAPPRFAPTFRDPAAAGVAERGPAPLLELPENRAALAAVRALAAAGAPDDSASRSEPAGAGRQLFLYGPAGCGKTRLVEELVRLDRGPAGEPRGAGTVRLTGAGLAAALDEALAGGFPGPLRDDLLGARLLIVEDLAGLRAKPKTQALLVAALDAAAEIGGRAVLTGPGLPGELPDVSRRLIDRLRGGVSVRVGTPGAASRAALLARFAEHEGTAADPAALRALAAGFDGASVRELAAAAGRLSALARAAGVGGWTAEVAAALLAGRAEHAGDAVTLAAVSRAVAARFGLTVAQVRAAGRGAAVVPARQAGMALARELTGEPLAAVAAHFGRSNHGTVLHAIRRCAQRSAADAAFRADVAAVRRALRAG